MNLTLRAPLRSASRLSAGILSLGTFLVAARVQAESLSFQAEWGDAEREKKAWVIVAPPGANPVARVVGFRVRPLTGTESGQIIGMADLPEGDRSQALDRVRSQISVREFGILRYWRLWRIEAARAQIGLGMKSFDLMELDLAIDGVDGASATSPAAQRARLDRGWGYKEILARLVDNPAQVPGSIDFNLPAPVDLPPCDWSPSQLPPGSVACRMDVSSDGLLRILPEHLRAIGLDPSKVDPATLRLVSRGADVALLRSDDGDGSFDAGESLVFLGRESESAYSVSRAYWLIVGDKAPPRAIADALPLQPTDPLPARDWHMARLTIDEDNPGLREVELGSNPDFLEVRKVRWLWDALSSDHPTTFTFGLPDFDASIPEAPADVRVTLRFYNQTEALGANRRIRFELNGVGLGDAVCSSARDVATEFRIPRVKLKGEGNLGRIRTVPGPPAAGAGQEGGSFFDTITIDYPRRLRAKDGLLRMKLFADDKPTTAVYAFTGFAGARPPLLLDASDPENPLRLRPLDSAEGGVRVAVGAAPPERVILAADEERITSSPLPVIMRPTRLRDRANEADYLIVSHPEFHDLLDPLIAQKRSEGMAVEAADILDIYNEFGYGEQSPLAIKRFLRYAVGNWKVPPTYVLLVGDCTSDYRDVAKEDLVNFVPAYRRDPPTSGDESRASDQWLTTFLGNDDLPDVILGRLSVNSRADATEVVRKAVAASKGLPPGPWRNRLLLIADNEDQFTDAADKERKEALPPSLFLERVYGPEFPLERNFYLDPESVEREDMKVSSKTTQAINDAFKKGIGFVSFYGHGSPNIWSNQRLWFGGDSLNSDNRLLRNDPYLPFVVNYTCNTGAIDYPVRPWNVCISEDMMRVRQGGARGMFVPSGPGLTTHHIQLAREVIRAFFDDRLQRQGDATALASIRFMEGGHPVEFPQMYLLLGDPSIPSPSPKGSCRLAASPAQLERGQSDSIKVSIQEAPIESGEAVFQLESPGGKAEPETAPAKFSATERSFSVQFPKNASSGTWRLKAYLWRASDGADASGWTEIRVGVRHAEIGDFLVMPPDAEGKKPRLSLLLRNPSNHSIQGVRFQVREPRGSQWAVIAEEQVDIEAGKESRWEREWEPSFGLHELEARLLNFDKAPTPYRALTTSRRLVWSHPDPKAPLQFALSSLSLRRTFQRVDKAGSEMEASLPVYLAGGAFQGPLEVGYRFADDPGSTMTLATVNFPAETPWASTPARFSLKSDGLKTRRAFHIEVDPRRQVATAEPRQPVRLSGTVDPSILPRLLFTDGVLLDPPQPVDGGTLWFHVGVRNAGGTAAGPFRVTAYEDDPTTGGRELANKVGPSYCAVEGLAPGEKTDAVIRWDPKRSAGDRRVWFRIFPLEGQPGVDTAPKPVPFRFRVATLAQLEPVGIFPDRDSPELERLRLPMKLVVRNTGESPARNVIFAFYNSRAKPLPPGSLVHEAFVEIIRPGETHEETYNWELPESYREMIKRREDFKIDFSGQVYLRGSLQRISVVEPSYLEKEPGP